MDFTHNNINSTDTGLYWVEFDSLKMFENMNIVIIMKKNIKKERNLTFAQVYLLYLSISRAMPNIFRELAVRHS